ncbi:winged helix-turn-helix transcriptional regulator [Rhodococcus sp. MEB064]|uniref:winged helix-turn-helix transcriptional regulator n=1 Tax=Rhodococcus sp. MEB064 TaxID=1587522 RepID=UPI001E36D83F|nr:winged helix-turn-helix transcriptional regulator [Rhodococcus sp. MEB064]
MRTVFPEIPPRVVYELTPLGEGLRPVLDAMNAWAMTMPSSTTVPSSTVEKTIVVTTGAKRDTDIGKTHGRVPRPVHSRS